MKNVTVYTSDRCAYCNALKAYLIENGVPFQEKNIRSPRYRRELILMRIMTVPAIKIDDTVIIGFDKEKIDEELQ